MLQVTAAATGNMRTGRIDPFASRSDHASKATSGIARLLLGELNRDRFARQCPRDKHGFAIKATNAVAAMGDAVNDDAVGTTHVALAARTLKATISRWVWAYMNASWITAGESWLVANAIQAMARMPPAGSAAALAWVA